MKSIGMLELGSTARGIYTADQMVKAANVEIAAAHTVCPGKYIIIVHGEVSAVQAAEECGVSCAGEYLIDHMVIYNVDPGVFPAIVGAVMPERIRAIGVIESYSLSAMVIAADEILKTAALEAIELRLGTGLGGKSYFLFTGDVAAVESGIRTGKQSLGEQGMLLNAEVLPSPSEVLISSLL